ncbi:MAG: hypothetical protein AAGG72_09145 [Pseudomonadota bacterium]
MRLIRKTCETHGIFDRLYTDNGSAFAGHLVAGGVDFKFRNARTNNGLRPLGVCHHLGIDISFALPGNAQAKIAERTFAALSRVLDDRPEFARAHAGHNPSAAPTKDCQPVPFETVSRVVAREIERDNYETGRRSQGANGRSYRQVFEHGFAERIVRRLTKRQLYMASLIYKPVSVDRDGRVTVDGWVYGDFRSQDALLRYHGQGQRVLLDRNPDDLSAPTLAFDHDGNLICQDIQHVKRGAYDSADGIKQAARNRAEARKAVKATQDANSSMADAELAEVLALLVDTVNGDTVERREEKVVAGHFKSPVRTSAPKPPPARTEEHLANLDAYLSKAPRGDKST